MRSEEPVNPLKLRGLAWFCPVAACSLLGLLAMYGGIIGPLVSDVKPDLDARPCEAYYLYVRKKHAGAVALGKRRWAKVSAAERSAALRAAVNARWARVRAERAAAAEEEARAS